MIKLPSLSHIYKLAADSAQRFYLSLLCAFVATISLVLYIELEDMGYEVLLTISSVAVLGIPLFLAIRAFSESNELKQTTRMLLEAAGVAGLILYFFSLPGPVFSSDPATLYRYLMFFAAVHLAVSFLPFISEGKTRLFWNFNKELFLRILLAAMYSFVLLIGLFIALLSVDNLLGFSVGSERYIQLFWIIFGMFNTWFFLSGVPHPLKTRIGYPRGLKVFVQYILIPLVTVYLLILYVYTLQIIFAFEWPYGWVSYLVISFSVAGVLSLLLLHPVQQQTRNTWISLYSKTFYIALIPLIILMLLSIGVRISEYGITVNRYLVAAIGLWLSIITGYFVFSRLKDIRFIPASLFVITLLISFGPWGAFQVSIQSQLKRFETILEQNQLLTPEGKFTTESDEISFEDRKNLSSIVYYLVEMHAAKELQSFFHEDIEREFEQRELTGVFQRAEWLVSVMGFDYVGRFTLEIDEHAPTRSTFRSGPTDKFRPMPGNGYFAPDISLNSGRTEYTLKLNEDDWYITLAPEVSGLTITGPASRYLETDFLNLADSLYTEFGGPETERAASIIPAEIEHKVQGEGFTALLDIRSLSFTRNGKLQVTSISFNLFIYPDER